MPAGQALDDDYVVSLLLKDSEANKKRYLSNGLGSLLSKKPSGNAPKPNTRFLRNIIKETDNHNAALKAREEEESKARLRDLKDHRPSKRSRDDEAAEGSYKRRRGEDKPGRWASVLGDLGARSEARGRQNQKTGSEGYKDTDRKQRRSRSRSRDRARAVRNANERLLNETQSSQRPRFERHRELQQKAKRRRRSRSSSRSRSPSHLPKSSVLRRTTPGDEGDSDPLEDIIGPRPPPKVLPRGRGAYKMASSIDDRFNPDYNPRADVDLSPDDGERNDWDMALEALRDRAKWRAQGGERLRAAGFSEDEVKKWEGSSGLLRSSDSSVEKDVEDVRWAKKGEGREWDRGKTINDDGTVELKADWGRLKGN